MPFEFEPKPWNETGEVDKGKAQARGVKRGNKVQAAMAAMRRLEKTRAKTT